MKCREEIKQVEALKAYKKIAFSFRRGGYLLHYEQSQEALEALERIKKCLDG